MVYRTESQKKKQIPIESQWNIRKQMENENKHPNKYNQNESNWSFHNIDRFTIQIVCGYFS